MKILFEKFPKFNLVILFDNEVMFLANLFFSEGEVKQKQVNYELAD